MTPGLHFISTSAVAGKFAESAGYSMYYVAIAVIAIIVGSICSVFVMQLSWYVSLIPTGVVYYFLMKTMKSSKGFRKGTIFED